MSYNPFDEIKAQLAEIKSILEEQKAASEKPVADPLNQFIPIKDIIGRYFTNRTFYNHVKDGTIKLYKFGALSFVKADEFFAQFEAIDICQKEN